VLDEQDQPVDCPHDWQITELRLTLRGADAVAMCIHCGTSRYEPGQAALGDARPPL